MTILCNIPKRRDTSHNIIIFDNKDNFYAKEHLTVIFASKNIQAPRTSLTEHSRGSIHTRRDDSTRRNYVSLREQLKLPEEKTKRSEAPE
jgi:hypothetical protein